MRRLAVTVSVLGLLCAVSSPPVRADAHGAGTYQLQLVEATVAQLQQAMQTGLLSSEQLVDMYLASRASLRTTMPDRE